jgi:AbrB family looped-hinge helix DNA binding protein
MRKRVQIATVGSRGRVTIPSQIRRALGVRSGGTVTFRLLDVGQVLMRKESGDEEFLALAVNTVFADWDSPEAERAFAKL